MITVRDALAHAVERLERAGIADATLEAQVLLSSILGISRARLIAALRDEVSGRELGQFQELVQRRLDHEPLAFIVGVREFFGIELASRPGALIPRPETEMLVEAALAFAGTRREETLQIADVGTGSGAIAVAIACEVDRARVVATDCSPDAIQVASDNVQRRNAANVSLVLTNLLDGLREFDIILANLPYVGEDEWELLAPEIREHEPRGALVGGTSGFEIVERMLSTAGEHLRPGGLLVAEIGSRQGQQGLAAARAFFPEALVRVRKDLAGLDRMLEVRT